MGTEGCGQHLGDVSMGRGPWVVPGHTVLSPGPHGCRTPQRGCWAGVTQQQVQLVPWLPPTKRHIKMLI